MGRGRVGVMLDEADTPTSAPPPPRQGPKTKRKPREVFGRRGQPTAEDREALEASLSAREKAYRDRESAIVVDTSVVPGSQKRDQRIAIVTALYHGGFTIGQIAQQTGLSRPQVSLDLETADKRTDIAKRLIGVGMRLDAEAVPLAVQNIINTLSLTGNDPEVARRRDEASFKILAGRGLLPGAQPGQGAATTGAVNLNVVFTGDRPTPATMQIVGSSRTEEAKDALRELSPPDPAPAPERPAPVAERQTEPVIGLGCPKTPDAAPVDTPRSLEY